MLSKASRYIVYYIQVLRVVVIFTSYNITHRNKIKTKLNSWSKDTLCGNKGNCLEKAGDWKKKVC